MKTIQFTVTIVQNIAFRELKYILDKFIPEIVCVNALHS